MRLMLKIHGGIRLLQVSITYVGEVRGYGR
jgi:hypothetical protein